jgi:hypothetical protein
MVEQRTSPKVGTRIRFRLYMGREVDGVIRAILKTLEGMRYRVEYGSNLATITPGAIVQPPGERDAPKDVEF